MINRKPQTAVFSDQDELLQFLIRKWKEISTGAVSDHGCFAAALSGGRTPIDFYGRLGRSKNDLPWKCTHLFFVDERFVPHTHPDSNYGMIRAALGIGLNIPETQIHPIPTETTSPETSARRYEKEIRDFFHVPPEETPSFDLILLGLGSDGHTASLFPGAVLHAGSADPIVLPVFLDEVRHDRVTLSLSVINKARHILFLVTGKEKAPALSKVLQRTAHGLPASMVDPESGELLFVIDSDAASGLG